MKIMMFRRLISIVVCTAMLSMLSVSCGMDEISQPDEIEPEMNIQMETLTQADGELARDGRDILIQEPGKIHNAILAEMNKDGIFTKGEALSEEEYIARIVEACNSVFRECRIGQEVVEDDIRSIFQCLDSWKDSGAFDAFSSLEERRIEDVYHLFDHMTSAGVGCDRGELEKIRMAIEELEGVGTVNCSRETIRKIANSYKSSDCTSESYRALTILEASCDFWAELNDKTMEIDTIRVIGDASQYDQLMAIDWYTINILLWDAVGALLCWPFGPLSVICAVVASSAYVLAISSE